MYVPMEKMQYHRMNQARFGQAPDSNPKHPINGLRSWANCCDQSNE
jgi:hypothetical protein